MVFASCAASCDKSASDFSAAFIFAVGAGLVYEFASPGSIWDVSTGCDRAIPKILIGRESDILSDKSNSYELLGKDIKIAG